MLKPVAYRIGLENTPKTEHRKPGYSIVTVRGKPDARTPLEGRRDPLQRLWSTAEKRHQSRHERTNAVPAHFFLKMNT